MLERILNFFGLTTIKDARERYNLGFSTGVSSERDRQINLRQKLELSCLKLMIGKPVICVGNEWEDLVIGIVTDIDFITQAKNPIPIVKDILTGKEFITFAKVMPFTMQRFNALVKLDPYERWSVIDNQNSFEHRSQVDRSKLPKLLSAEEWVMLMKNQKFIGFREEAKE